MDRSRTNPNEFWVSTMNVFVEIVQEVIYEQCLLLTADSHFFFIKCLGSMRIALAKATFENFERTALSLENGT